MALDYGEIGEARNDGNVLLVNGRTFAKFHSPALARACAEAVLRVRDAPQAKREKVARELVAASFDKREAARRLSEAERQASRLRPWCQGFFIYIYLVNPLLVLAFGLDRLILPMGASLFLFGFYLTFRFHRSHQRLYPEAVQERAGGDFRMALCPPGAAQASDLLSMNAVAMFHPVVAGSLVARTGFKDMILPIVRRLRHPQKDIGRDPRCAALLDWFAKTQLEYCASYLKAEENIDIEGMADQPARESGCTHYCPRCHAQFSKALQECSDCAGVRVIAFAPPTKEAGREDIG
jgi:hypothetical protein